MRTISINVQITKCPRQYEAVRLGMDVELETGDNATEAIKKVTAELNDTYNAMYAPAAPAQTPAQALVSVAEAAQAVAANVKGKATKAKTKAQAEAEAEAEAKAEAEAQAQAQAEAQAQAQAEAQAQAVVQNSTTDNREPLAFSDPRLQQIFRRMEKAAGDAQELKRIYDNTYKYFKPDENAAKALKLAAAIV